MSRLTDEWYWCCYHADCKMDFIKLEYSMNEMYLHKQVTYEIYKEMKATYNYYKRIFEIKTVHKAMEMQ